MHISENIQAINKDLPSSVTLVAVSKTKSNPLIMEAYEAGQRIFGENRPQELMQKYSDLPKDIEWHFIGHPQSKQVKYFAPFVSLIHGVDSLKLLEVINKEALKNHRIIRCLLQFYIATEETKFGLDLDEAFELLNSSAFKDLKNIQICGVMGMATYTSNSEKIRSEFKMLREYFVCIKNEYYSTDTAFKELSMGMSNDYHIAVAEGSTMIRVGSSIFGDRF